MKEFLEKTFYHNTIADWGISLLIILGSVLAGKVLYWVVGKVVKRITARTKTRLDDILVDMLEEPVIFALTVIGIWIGESRLEFTPAIDAWLDKIFYVLITVNATWLVARVLDAIIEEYIVPLAQRSESDLDDQLLPLVRKGLRSVIWILGIIMALNNAGFDVGALLAGLGIGGLALAMAAKDSVSNIFGGITILTDKPFKVGDRIRIDGFDGTIEEIGIRSTRLRTLEGRLVTIPNLRFTEGSVENISQEPNRKVTLKLGLVYDTTAAQMEEALAILRAIALEHASTEDEVKVSFDAFGDFALSITFIYYIKKGADLYGTPTAVNLAIMRRFKEAGLEMAFPTQTVYHIKGD